MPVSEYEQVSEDHVTLRMIFWTQYEVSETSLLYTTAHYLGFDIILFFVQNISENNCSISPIIMTNDEKEQPAVKKTRTTDSGNAGEFASHVSLGGDF